MYIYYICIYMYVCKYIISIAFYITLYYIYICIYLYCLFVVYFCKDKVNPPCEMTERRILTMAQQVASALVCLLMNQTHC